MLGGHDRLALLRSFLSDAEERVARIDTGLADPAPAFDALALDAHTIVGAASVVGLLSLADTARGLEHSLAAADVPAARSRLAELVRELARARRQRRVLAIEDDPTNRLLLERIAERDPRVELTVAPDGTDGLRLARELLPDLVLLDLRLPDMNGVDVLAGLLAEESTRNIPVVVLSSDAAPLRAAELTAAGAAEYLAKPLDLDRLLRLMAHGLG